MEYYEAYGNVRGSCGHKHKRAEAAIACMRKDERACRAIGGGAYSDRYIRHIVDGETVPLDEAERRMAQGD